MGNIPLSAEDIAFLKGKGNRKNSTQDIKNAFKEFAQDLGAENKKMDEWTNPGFTNISSMPLTQIR